MKPLTIFVRGVKWTLKFYTPRGNQWGWCFPKRKKLLVSQHLRGKKELEILLHEFNHALQPDLSEDAILQLSSDQADYLYDVLHYRRTKR